MVIHLAGNGFSVALLAYLVSGVAWNLRLLQYGWVVLE